jgi:hypothetical protein
LEGVGDPVECSARILVDPIADGVRYIGDVDQVRDDLFGWSAPQELDLRGQLGQR